MSDSIRLKVSETEESLFGKSKFLGNPDVWDDFEWPAIGDGDDAYDLTFICQINCAEIAPYDKDNKLPHTGMLYFFYDLEEMPDDPFDQNTARVLYYDGDLENLIEVKVVDEDGEPLAHTEQKITFENVEDGFMAEEEETHRMLGVPSNECYFELPYGFEEMLLQIDSFEADGVDYNFGDVGFLCFFIRPKDLAKKDFKDVRTALLYE